MNKHEQEENLAVGEECSILVETKSGDVTVSAWDRSEVGMAEGSDRLAMERRDDEIRVRAHRGGSDDVRIHVPRHCELRVRTLSGDIQVTGIDGQLDVMSLSGDIEAKQMAGELRAHSVSGDITASGEELHKFDLDSVSGTLAVGTALVDSGSYTLHSVSGNVKLRIPDNQACTIEFNSLSGDLRCDLPYSGDIKGRGRAEARVNGGGVPVKVHTTSGSVRVGAWTGEQPAPEPEPEPVMAQEQPFSGRDTRPLNRDTVEAEPFGLDAEPEMARSSEAGEAEGSVAERRMRILREIEAGHLTVSEGLEQLRSLE